MSTLRSSSASPTISEVSARVEIIDATHGAGQVRPHYAGRLRSDRPTRLTSASGWRPAGRGGAAAGQPVRPIASVGGKQQRTGPLPGRRRRRAHLYVGEQRVGSRVPVRVPRSRGRGVPGLFDGCRQPRDRPGTRRRSSRSLEDAGARGCVPRRAAVVLPWRACVVAPAPTQRPALVKSTDAGVRVQCDAAAAASRPAPEADREPGRPVWLLERAVAGLKRGGVRPDLRPAPPPCAGPPAGRVLFGPTAPSREARAFSAVAGDCCPTGPDPYAGGVILPCDVGSVRSAPSRCCLNHASGQAWVISLVVTRRNCRRCLAPGEPGRPPSGTPASRSIAAIVREASLAEAPAPGQGSPVGMGSHRSWCPWRLVLLAGCGKKVCSALARLAGGAHRAGDPCSERLHSPSCRHSRGVRGDRPGHGRRPGLQQRWVRAAPARRARRCRPNP
jgi:hypothetical protein